jgi:lysophospholipase L1-like esterase
MRLRHRLGFGFAALALAASSCLWDVNEDDTLVVACLGDSNTSWPWFGGYCESVAAEHPDVVVLNYAVPGSRAIGGAFDGLAQIEWAATGDPAAGKLPADVVVLAFGTNDIGHDGAITAEEMADRIDALKAAATALGMPAYVASIPPRFLGRATDASPCTPNPAATPVIEAANALIRRRTWPRWLVDFHSGFTCPAHFAVDGVHFNQAGQDLRAARVDELLFSQPEAP